MGLLDDASSVLDAATSGAKTSKSDAEAKYELKDFLSTPDPGDYGYVGPSHTGQGDNPNPLDGGLTTEFIHFGMVHPDTGKKFPGKFDPSKYDSGDATTLPEGHAVMFRDAVEREAIALFGFVSSTKLALIETTASRGALEEVGAMASNLLGSSGGPAKPDPQQLDTFLSDIKSAAATINKSDIQYPEIHDAGKKLHEIRAKYVAFCKSLNEFYIEKPPSNNPMDMAAGAIANIPGVGNIMAIVQKFAFKFLDLYLAGYLKLRENHEKSVELGAHDLTIAAIEGGFTDHFPTYPVWFKKPDPKPKDAAPAPVDNNPKFIRDINAEIQKAKQKVDDAKQGVKDEVDNIEDFLGMNGEPEPTPGSGALSAIFASMKGPAQTAQDPTAPPPTPGASACMIDGMNTALKDIHGIPPFVKKVMVKINDANVDLLQEIYARLMASPIDEFTSSEKDDEQQQEKKLDKEVEDALKTLPPDTTPEDREAIKQELTNQGQAKIRAEIRGKSLAPLILAAARHSLPKTIFAVMNDLATGVVPTNFSMNTPDGKKIDAQNFVAKIVEDKLMPFIDPVLQYMVGDLAGNMGASLQKARDNQAQTMEVLLGRLPLFTAQMFRNTFFPIWNLVIEKVFDTVAPQVSKVVKSVNNVFNGMKDNVDQASDYQHRAENVQTKAASGVSSLQDLKDLKDDAKNESDESKQRKAQRAQADKDKQAMEDFYKSNNKDEKFPVTSRVPDGDGQKVVDDVPSVLPDTPTNNSTDQTASDSSSSANDSSSSTSDSSAPSTPPTQ